MIDSLVPRPFPLASCFASDERLEVGKRLIIEVYMQSVVHCSSCSNSGVSMVIVFPLTAAELRQKSRGGSATPVVSSVMSSISTAG